MCTVPSEQARLWLLVACSRAPGSGALRTSAVAVWETCLSPVAFHTGVQPQSCSLLLSISVRAGKAAGAEHRDCKCSSLLVALFWRLVGLFSDLKTSTALQGKHMIYRTHLLINLEIQ